MYMTILILGLVGELVENSNVYSLLIFNRIGSVRGCLSYALGAYIALAATALVL